MTMRLYFVTALAIVATSACDRKPSSAEQGSSAAVSSQKPVAKSKVPFPAYPPNASKAGVLWLKSNGGPLGEQLYRAAPREQNVGSDGVYSQSAAEKREGGPVVYTLNVGGKKPGVYDLGSEVKFYIGDGTGTNDEHYTVSGKLRIDVNDTTKKHFKGVIVGAAKNDKSGEQSPIVAALVILPSS